MTEVQPPSWMAGECYTAEADRAMISSIVCSPGIVGAGALLVNPGDGLTVTVDPGAAFIEGTITATQGMYHVVNDSLKTLTLAGADVTDVRYDLVVATVNDSAYAGDVNNWVLQVITGTPSPTPVVPELPDSSIPLARVTVGPGVTTIGPDEVVDLRQSYSSCSAPVMTPPIAITSAGSSTFDPADYPGLTMVYVECIGGGGGGGGAGTTASSGETANGSGGGGGAFASGWIPATDLDGPVTITVGAAGAAGPTGATNPTDGGASSFGSYVIAGGGRAGTSKPGNSASFGNESGGAGGQPGSGTAHFVAISGANGDNAAGYPTGNIAIFPGYGGAAARGGAGGRLGGGDAGQAGGDGSAPGGGGCGAFNRQNQSVRAGGAGAVGAVYITVYR